MGYWVGGGTAGSYGRGGEEVNDYAGDIDDGTRGMLEGNTERGEGGLLGGGGEKTAAGLHV